MEQLEYPIVLKNIIDQSNEHIEQCVYDLIRSKRIDFPKVKYFLPSSDQMFKNLQEYRPIITKNPYNLTFFYSSTTFKPLFDGYYILIISDLTTYQSYKTIDGLTDHFNEEVRIKSHKKNKFSISNLWNHARTIKEIIYDLNLTHDSQIEAESLRNGLFRRTKEPGLFRLTWCKGIFNVLFANNVKDWNILDISAGWGDRLINAILHDCYYLGFDPNVNLKPGHDNIIKKFGDSKKQQVIYIPFEDSQLIKETYDVVFSSPPFFNIEIYHHDKNGNLTQSVNRYPSYENWLHHFLFASLYKSWISLKVGGHLVIHMGDTINLSICQPMIDYVNSFNNSNYIGVIGVTGNNDTTSGVWVWKKICGY